MLNFACEGIGLKQCGARAAIDLNKRALDQYYSRQSANDRLRRKIVWDPRTH